MMKNLQIEKSNNNQHNYYHSFLLRIWQTQESEHSVWHFSLENPLTHEILAFQNTQNLSDYLTQIIEIKQADPMK